MPPILGSKRGIGRQSVLRSQGERCPERPVKGSQRQRLDPTRDHNAAQKPTSKWSDTKHAVHEPAKPSNNRDSEPTELAQHGQHEVVNAAQRHKLIRSCPEQFLHGALAAQR